MTKEEHQNAVKGKSIGEAQAHCIKHRIWCRVVEPDEKPEMGQVKRLNLFTREKKVIDTKWG